MTEPTAPVPPTSSPDPHARPDGVPPSDPEANQYAVWVHVSLFAGYIVPLAGLIVPIILWQMKKDQWPIIDRHGRQAVNFAITNAVLWLVLAVFFFIPIVGCFFIPLAPIAALYGLIPPIIAAVKASDGTVWRYPALPFIS
jgi:uncharacterized Tic20 family protein